MYFSLFIKTKKWSLSRHGKRLNMGTTTVFASEKNQRKSAQMSAICLPKYSVNGNRLRLARVVKKTLALISHLWLSAFLGKYNSYKTFTFSGKIIPVVVDAVAF